MPTRADHDAGPVLAIGGFPRPRTKALPRASRRHNLSLVLQTLFRGGPLSRADLARETGLTRVTVSELVAALLADGLVAELGHREGTRPGKPATLVDLARNAHRIVGVDLSDAGVFRGAVLGLDGDVLDRAEVSARGATGEEAVRLALDLAGDLIRRAPAPVLGIGVGSPGIVDLAGTVLSAPNLGWQGEPLRARMETATGLPVTVANDANAAALAEYSFGGALGDTLVVRVGAGVGAGLLVGGLPVFGARFAAGELGHVVVGTDGGPLCVCGKRGCLESWLAVPRLEAALAGAADATGRTALLREAGHRLGIALAPVVGALDLGEIVLSGPADLLDGALSDATRDTLRDRTMARYHDHVTLRSTRLGGDIVLRGAAAMVLSTRLGVS